MGDAARLMQAYDVRPADPLLRAGALSGGNQQKLVLGREIEQRPRLLLVGQPTRGVDIGAIAFIHRRLSFSANVEQARMIGERNRKPGENEIGRVIESETNAFTTTKRATQHDG